MFGRRAVGRGAPVDTVRHIAGTPKRPLLGHARAPAAREWRYAVPVPAWTRTSLGYQVTLIADAHSAFERDYLSAARVIEHHSRILDGFAAGKARVSVVRSDRVGFGRRELGAGGRTRAAPDLGLALLVRGSRAGVARQPVPEFQARHAAHRPGVAFRRERRGVVQARERDVDERGVGRGPRRRGACRSSGRTTARRWRTTRTSRARPGTRRSHGLAICPRRRSARRPLAGRCGSGTSRPATAALPGNSAPHRTGIHRQPSQARRPGPVLGTRTKR
jgi:hypothetical protein